MTERSAPRPEASDHTQLQGRPAVVLGDDDDALSGKKQRDQRAYRQATVDQKDRQQPWRHCSLPKTTEQ